MDRNSYYGADSASITPLEDVSCVCQDSLWVLGTEWFEIEM